ncbi:MAG TPA: TIGR03618 family F420-dependent PPOX class oxidoreductase [Actinomycetota bacterium]|nr:TIGR03618 family F420-dependent PPOX class oxidoreductase [Actinomycetota bacterium]
MINEHVRAVLESDTLAHLVTLDEDGSPYVTIVWAGLDGDEIVCGTLFDQRKLRNVRRDPRVVLSFQTDKTNEMGLREYLVVYGRGTVVEGGAPELLQELAYTYIGPGVDFPPMPDPPPGYVTRVRVDRLAGIGPWK